ATQGVAPALTAHADVKEKATLQRVAHLAILNAPLVPGDRDIIVFSAWWYLWQGKMELAIFRPDAPIESFTQVDVRDVPLRPTPTAPNALTLDLLDGAGTRIQKTFDQSLESSCLLVLRDGALVRVRAPAIGESRLW